MTKSKSKRKRAPKHVLKLPDLEQSKSAVLNSLTSRSSQRTYDHAIREFIEWYCSEPRLAFASLGIYGTISYLVNEQSREIAIRLALGAQRRDILGMVLRQGLTLAAVGAGIGLAGAFLVSHLMAGLLYGVSPYDLSIFVSVTAVLTAVAIAASYVPALRAMRLDPITTLHAE